MKEAGSQRGDCRGGATKSRRRPGNNMAVVAMFGSGSSCGRYSAVAAVLPATPAAIACGMKLEGRVERKRSCAVALSCSTTAVAVLPWLNSALVVVLIVITRQKSKLQSSFYGWVLPGPRRKAERNPINRHHHFGATRLETVNKHFGVA